MFSFADICALVEMAGTYRMPNGWSVVIRADWVDASVNRPHGLSYALVLKDECGNRLLGFDNSHPYDGAPEDEPFDHEHRPGKIGQRLRYSVVSMSNLITDFFARCETYCRAIGVAFEFEEEASDDL